MDQQQPVVQNPFTDVPYVALPVPVVQDKQFLSDVAELQVGAGSAKVFRSNKQGIWLGNKTFTNAPFKVDMQGNVTANSFTTNDYVPVGGAASDVNGNGTSINANRINASSLSAISADLGTITAGSITVVNGGNTIGFTPTGTNAIFSGTTGSPEFKVTPAGAVTCSNITITGGSLAIGSNFSVNNSGDVVMRSWSIGVSAASDVTGVSGGIAFKNNKGIYMYDSTNSSLIASVTADGSNILSVFNSSGIVELRTSTSNKVRIIANNNTCLEANTDGSISTNAISCTTLNVSSGITLGGDSIAITSSGSQVLINNSKTLNCGNINCNTIEMNNNAVGNTSLIQFQARSTSWTPGDREFGSEDNGTNQRLRMKFQNNGTQWQVTLSAVCTPVNMRDVDPEYTKKYELMEDMDESRFKMRYANTKDVQKEYRGRPLSHFPSMGDPDGSAWKKHMDALWKRPWIPMKRIPDRMETMGQYPYAPVHSPLIGEGESMANMYQLLAHAYNQLQERCDKLEDQVRRLSENV